ncbi:MAG TPA: PfkB family carbohydrate kinase [Pseudonocardiaceae bacterium]|nr:PfkB family carbohydrate kinase [Pseudonocardiaceae bacterium]
MSPRLVVLGDALLDRDIEGAADRLCPDAPAPVLTQTSAVDRPGGAALAAVLAAGFGYDVTLVAAIAADEAGGRLHGLLDAAGVQVCALPLPTATPEKIRLRAGGYVLLRLDRGGGRAPLTAGELPAAARDALRRAAAVLVSDYGQGMTRLAPLRAAIAERDGTPVVWDPHPRGAVAVPGARLATPNEAELARLVGTPTAGAHRLTAVAGSAAALRERWRTGAVAVTLGADGALLCHGGATPLVVPPPAGLALATVDTCGAGDCFAAAATAALAGGALVSEAVQEAVCRASLFVAAGGAGTVRLSGSQPLPGPARLSGPERPSGRGRLSSPERLSGREPLSSPEPEWRPAGSGPPADDVVAAVRSRGGTVVATGGCFDLVHAGHVATLEAARRLGDCLVVCINSDASVAALKGPERPVVPAADRARLLQALACVDAVVVFDEATPHAVLRQLRPDVWVKGGDYFDGPAEAPALPEAELVRSWGGQTVVVPYLAGRSTTDMISAVRRSETWARRPGDPVEARRGST